MENLKALLQNLSTIGIFGRIFNWGTVRELLVKASMEFSTLYSSHEKLKVDFMEVSQKVKDLQKDLDNVKAQVVEKNNTLEKEVEGRKQFQLQNGELQKELAKEKSSRQYEEKRKDELAFELEGLNKQYDVLSGENSQLKGKVIEFESQQETKASEHQSAIKTLTDIQSRITLEREQEKSEAHEKEITRLTTMKETWARHQNSVKEQIKVVALKNTVEYVEAFPFKLEPDNCLLICEEYVVFDAKSPAGDNLKNFPAYLKDQAEKAKKYAKIEEVKTDIFFVVPTNTLDHLEKFVFNHGDHTVYVISVDALEPIIINLKKIEDYEFAEQLRPEDRENICRVIGRFAHLNKRRIQVDNYFAKQFIEIAYTCESDIPADFLDKVKDFEKSQKLNPPRENRAKAIPLEDIVRENETIIREGEGRGVEMETSKLGESFSQLPLYKDPH